MKPFYEGNGVTLYHGDMRELAGDLKGNVVVTDPPYGMNIQNGRVTISTNGKRQFEEKGATYDDSPEYARALVPPLMALVSRIGRGAIWTGTKILDAYLAERYPSAIGGMFHSGGAMRSSWGFQRISPILFYGKDPQPVAQPNAAYHGKRANQKGLLKHATPKPFNDAVWLVKRASLKGETVIDPFMGSGTTLVAAMRTGRKAVGVEISEEFCEFAARRIESNATTE